MAEWSFLHISTRTVVAYEIFFFFLMRHVGVLGIIVGQFILERTKAGAFFLYHLYIEILVGMEEITEMLFVSAGTICFHFVFM